MDRDREPRFVNEDAADLVRGLEAVSNDLSSLASFMRAAESMRSEQPDEQTQARHLAAISAETAVLRAARAAAPAHKRGLLRSRSFKATTIGLAAVLATGGLAAAKTLPAPAQNVVAAVANAIGIDIPRAEEKRDATADPHGDDDGDGIPNGEDPNTKTGMDHDGDGFPDDNGKRQTPKDGLDHDGDGTPDDNGERVGPSEGRGNAGAEKPERPDGPATKTPKPEKTAKPDAPASPKSDNANGQPHEDADPGRPDDPGNPHG